MSIEDLLESHGTLESIYCFSPPLSLPNQDKAEISFASSTPSLYCKMRLKQPHDPSCRLSRAALVLWLSGVGGSSESAGAT